jgi:hypothetical protein
MGVGVLLETNSHTTDLDLHDNCLGNEGESLLARYLGNYALPNLTRLAIHSCDVGDDGLIALVSTLERNTSWLHFRVRKNSLWLWRRVSQRLKLVCKSCLYHAFIVGRFAQENEPVSIPCCRLRTFSDPFNS